MTRTRVAYGSSTGRREAESAPISALYDSSCLEYMSSVITINDSARRAEKETQQKKKQKEHEQLSR